MSDKKLNFYIKPLKKNIDVDKIDFRNKMLIFNSNQIDYLFKKFVGEPWNSGDWEKFNKFQDKYFTSRQSMAGYSFKKKYICFPKELKYLEKYL